MRGLEGIADDFHGLVKYVETTLSSTRYRRVITLGVSVGGFAALWAAVLMGAHRGISVGGCPPSLLPSPLQNRPQSHATDLCFVYGEECVVDHKSALALSDVFGGRLVPVSEVDTHGVLGQLMKRGQLAGFLNEMLG